MLTLSILSLLGVLVYLPKHPSLTVIHDAAAEAKRTGNSAVEIPGGEGLGLVFPGTEIAFKSSLLVEATLLEKQTILVTSPAEEIVTYLHFRIDKRLNKVAVPGGEMPRHVPDRLRSLRDDDLIIPRPFGQLVVDGVSVTEGNDLPDFVAGRNYFMLVQFNGSPMGTLPYGGAACVWEIDGDNLLPLRPRHDVAIAFKNEGLDRRSAVQLRLAGKK